MKRINVLYIVAIVLGFLLYTFYKEFKSESAFFYGFAENKEMQISHNSDVRISKILVTPGQVVQQGDLLMVVNNTNLPVKIDALELEKQALNVDNIKDRKQVEFKISGLRIEKINKINELTVKINELNKEIELNDKLYEGLKSIKKKESNEKSPKQLEVDYLVNRLTEVSKEYDEEISYHEGMLSRIAKPNVIQKEIIEKKISHIKDKQEELSIYAPEDGMIGSILCKENENISSFTTLLNFYQKNPTQVKGFVHESMLLNVKLGNKLEITSSMHTKHRITGEITGLGSRIVEIPERLRKIPELKSYGREILITISPNNKFLQKEKVMVKKIVNPSNDSKK